MKIIVTTGNDEALVTLSYTELNALTGNIYYRDNHPRVGATLDIQKVCERTKGIYAAPDSIKRSAGSLRAIADLMERVTETIVPESVEIKLN